MKTKYILILSLFFLSSCVSKKKFTEQSGEIKQLELENEALENKLEDAVEANAGLEAKADFFGKQNATLKNDTTKLGQKLRAEQSKNKELNKLYEDLVDQNKKLLSASSAQKQRLLSELEKQKREVASKNATLTEKEKSLKKQQQEMDVLQAAIKQKEATIEELQRLLKEREEKISGLKNRIEQALLNFDKDELSVEIRDGKIYVSLAEKLLFQSGSTAVDAKGVDALSKLARVLDKQTEINILIEGHTDNVPVGSNASFKDNWDLSVLRATSIVRILLDKGNIDPEMVVASGRGEHVPVADNSTKDGRAKNRRTEIILSPNLGEIFEILESDF
ncbi:MAG: OmpA family protein [Chitinophagales bacterium]